MTRGMLGILLLASCYQASAQSGAAETGLPAYDLGEYDFDRGPSVQVDRLWHIYWAQLLTPGPGWSGMTHMEPLGYCTYRLALKLPHNHHGLSIYFPTVNAACRIWLNGKWVASSGIVSDKPESYRAELTTLLVPLPDQEENVDILIQISNLTHPAGGFSSYPRIDRTPDLVEGLTRSNGIQNFFAGCLIAMALYQLILFFLYRKGRPFLWLALICLGVAIRAMVIHGGSLLLPNLFQGVSWETWKKLEFGSVYAMVAFFPLYIYDLFPRYATRKHLVFFVILGFLTAGLVVITKPGYFRDCPRDCARCIPADFCLRIYYDWTRLERRGMGCEDHLVRYRGELSVHPS